MDKQTDRQTDGQRYRRTDFAVASSTLYYVARPKMQFQFF